MNYATVNNLDDFLASLGIAHVSWDLAAARQSGIDRWEELTDWKPFLAGAASDEYFPLVGVRRFRIPGSGLISFSSIEIAGVTLAEDQYIQKPLRSQTTRSLDFLDYQDGYLMIRDAVFGYTTSLTQDHHDVTLLLMAMQAISMNTPGGLAQGTTATAGAVAKEKVGPVERWHQTVTESGLLSAVEDQAAIQAWGSRVMAAVSSVRRKAVA